MKKNMLIILFFLVTLCSYAGIPTVTSTNEVKKNINTKLIDVFDNISIEEDSEFLDVLIKVKVSEDGRATITDVKTSNLELKSILLEKSFKCKCIDCKCADCSCKNSYEFTFKYRLIVKNPEIYTVY